jgi:hypothetical protein
LFLNRFNESLIGNELALLYLAFFLTFWAVLHHKILLAGLGIGIGYLCRGEFLLILFPIFIHLLILTRHQSMTLRFKQITWLIAKILIIPLLLAFAWHLYYYVTFGNLFPDTLHAKMLQGQSGLLPLYYDHVWFNITKILSGKIYLIILVLIGIFWQPYIFFFTSSYFCLHYLLYWYLKVPSYHWYYYDVYFITLFSLVLGMSAILKWVAHIFSGLLSKKARNFSMLYYIIQGVLVILLIPFAFSTKASGFKLASNTIFGNYPSGDERYDTYLVLCNKLKNELEPGDAVLTPEVGIISYYLPGIAIRDMNGLASPDITLQNFNNYDYFVDHYKPKFIIYPWEKPSEISKQFSYNGKTYLYKLEFITNPNAIKFFSAVYRLELVMDK